MAASWPRESGRSLHARPEALVFDPDRRTALWTRCRRAAQRQGELRSSKTRYNSSVMRALLFFISALVVSLMLLFWHLRSTKHAADPSAWTPPSPSDATSGTASAADRARTSSESAPTSVHAHNLMLRKGPNFRVYIRWLRGQMVRTHRAVNPSFDDPESFFIDVNSGVIRANIGDIGNFLNGTGSAASPLKNIILSGDGNQVKIRGTLHKIISLPIELIGTIATVPDNQIQIHVTKLNV